MSNYLLMTLGFTLVFISPVFFYAGKTVTASVFLMLGIVIVVMSLTKVTKVEKDGE